MKPYLLALLLFFIACGRPGVPHDIDPYFNSYIQTFKSEADAHGTGYGDLDSITVIKFKDSSTINDRSIDNIVGDCQSHTVEKMGKTSYYKEIDIDQSFKDLTSEIDKTTIFLHEMGHCAYHLQHSSFYFDIMYPESPDLTPKDFESSKNRYFQTALDNQSNWFNTN